MATSSTPAHASISTGNPLMKVQAIDSKEHFEKILDDAGNKVILIEFFATWCGPCKILGPRLEELAALYGSKLVIVKIDVDDFEEIAIEYEVSSMPTFVIMKNKKKLDQFVGSNSEKVESGLVKYVGEPPLPAAVEASSSGTSVRAIATTTTIASTATPSSQKA